MGGAVVVAMFIGIGVVVVVEGGNEGAAMVPGMGGLDTSRGETMSGSTAMGMAMVDGITIAPVTVPSTQDAE
jgi:hypothetical protein